MYSYSLHLPSGSRKPFSSDGLVLPDESFAVIFEVVLLSENRNVAKDVMTQDLIAKYNSDTDTEDRADAGAGRRQSQ